MQWWWGTYKTVENSGFLWYDSAEYFSEEYSMVNVCDIEVMKPLLAVHGFHFSKAKGQNLFCNRYPRKYTVHLLLPKAMHCL